jgi:hypothetical protein
MIELYDIAAAVASRLAPSRVVVEEPKQTDLAKGPLTYVVIEPIADETVGGALLADRNVLVDLAYLDKARVDQRGYYSFVADMNRVLRPTLQFVGREILLQQIQSRLVDGVAHYMFQLHFWDDIDLSPSAYERMQTLFLQKDVK